MSSIEANTLKVVHQTPLGLSSAARAVAIRIYRSATEREALFGEDLFFDPAWHMLLDLAIWHGRRDLSVSAVCLGARAPHATAMRYLTELMRRGYVDRMPDPTDRRRSHVQLSELGASRMEALLLRLA